MGRAQGVGRVDPAVRVQDVLWDLPRVDAHDRRADVLPRGHDEREGQQGHDGDPVVQPENRPVGVIPADLHQTLEPEKEVQHGGGGTFWLLLCTEGWFLSRSVIGSWLALISLLRSSCPEQQGHDWLHYSFNEHILDFA